MIDYDEFQFSYSADDDGVYIEHMPCSNKPDGSLNLGFSATLSDALDWADTHVCSGN